MSTQGTMSDQSATAIGAAGSDSSPSTGLDMPSVEQILSGFPGKPASLPPRGQETISQEEQENLLRALQTAIENVQGTTEAGNGFELKELHSSLEQAADTRPNQRYLEVAQNVRSILDQLWSSNSELLTQAAEILANGSRDRKSVSHVLTKYQATYCSQLHGALLLANLVF